MRLNMSPFECGQEDSLFNKTPNPRLLKDGVDQSLKTPSLIQQYFNGMKDAEVFYGGCSETDNE